MLRPKTVRNVLCNTNYGLEISQVHSNQAEDLISGYTKSTATQEPRGVSMEVAYNCIDKSQADRQITPTPGLSEALLLTVYAVRISSSSIRSLQLRTLGDCACSSGSRAKFILCGVVMAAVCSTQRSRIASRVHRNWKATSRDLLR